MLTVFPEYHKIQTLYKRNPKRKKEILLGQYTKPEFEYLSGNEWFGTEKVDGTNIRVKVKPRETHGQVSHIYGGRTDAANLDDRLITALDKVFNFDTLFRIQDLFPGGVIFYGEGYGAKIQKGGGNYRPDQGFVLFDVLVPDAETEGKVWWLRREDVEDLASQLGIDVVPVVARGTLHELESLVQGGLTSKWGDFPSEGLVIQPTVPLWARGGDRVITKLKTKDFEILARIQREGK